MLRWEYYKRFKERFKRFAFLENLPNKIAFLIYITLKIIQGLTVYIIAKGFENAKYMIPIACVILFSVWIIDIRDTEIKIKDIVTQDKIIPFYKTYSNYSEKKLAIKIVLSEVLWGASDIIGFYFPLLLLMFGLRMSIYKAILFTTIAVAVLYIIKTIILYCYYRKVCNSNKKSEKIQVIFSLLILSICIWIGNCFGEFIIKCPLYLKNDVVDGLKKWALGIKDISLHISCEQVKMLISFLILYICFLVVVRYFRKNVRNKFKINKKRFGYSIYRNEFMKVRDISPFTLIFMGLFVGILYEKGCSSNEMSILVGKLMISYTISWMLDDMLSNHDELLIDSDGKKLYYWKDKMNYLLKYKFILFIRNYITEISLLYVIMYSLTFHSILDVVYWICNMVILILFLAIGFVRKNMAIANSPQVLSDDYEKTKYNYGRVLESDFNGQEMMIVAIIVAIPEILFACKEIGRDIFWGLQITLIAGLIIYLILNYKKLERTIMKPSWIINLFDEENQTDAN